MCTSLLTDHDQYSPPHCLIDRRRLTPLPPPVLPTPKEGSRPEIGYNLTQNPIFRNIFYNLGRSPPTTTEIGGQSPPKKFWA